MKKISVDVLRLAPVFLLLAYTACGGSSEPTEPPVATTLEANSATTIDGVAGAVVTPSPSVIVKDQFGEPMAGQTVTFSVVSGGGSVSGASVVTNASGIATVGAWTLGSAVGSNVLNATSGSLTAVAFTATSAAGTAASLAKNAGDNQTAAPGAAVPIQPSVIVKDANGNPKSGVSVTFAVASGGGSVTGGAAVTNASGIATVGSWTLGSSPGSNSLSATVTGLPPVTFTATAVSAACAARTPHTFGTVSSGTLSSDDCQFVDGTFVDFFSVSIPEAGAYLFRQGAPFDTYLVLTTADGTPIGENDDATTSTTSSAVKALLPPGNYVLGAGSFEVTTGNYEISSTTASPEVSGCELVFIVKNVTTSQNILTSDCNLAASGASPIYADGYFIFLTAGTTVTINMSSSTIDSFLQVVRADGAGVATNDNVDSSTKDARITFTAAQTHYYAIFARNVPTTATGAYTLSIQ